MMPTWLYFEGVAGAAKLYIQVTRNDAAAGLVALADDVTDELVAELEPDEQLASTKATPAEATPSNQVRLPTIERLIDNGPLANMVHHVTASPGAPRNESDDPG